MSSEWQYETLEFSSHQDIQEVLQEYRRRGYRVFHAFYAPGGSYRFLVGKHKFDWFEP